MSLVLRRVPGPERVQTLLHHMIEEDVDRREQEDADAVVGWGSASWTATLRTDPVP